MQVLSGASVEGLLFFLKKVTRKLFLKIAFKKLFSKTFQIDPNWGEREREKVFEAMNDMMSD